MRGSACLIVVGDPAGIKPNGGEGGRPDRRVGYLRDEFAGDLTSYLV
jgi:hypothetical protein